MPFNADRIALQSQVHNVQPSSIGHPVLLNYTVLAKNFHTKQTICLQITNYYASCLDALFRSKTRFNSHPDVGCITQITIRITALTHTRLSIVTKQTAIIWSMCSNDGFVQTPTNLCILYILWLLCFVHFMAYMYHPLVSCPVRVHLPAKNGLVNKVGFFQLITQKR